MKSDLQIHKAIEVLVYLSSAADNRSDTEALRRDLGLTEHELETCLELISNLADREGGARVALVRDGDEVSLLGSAGKMTLLRLDMGEGAALANTLDELDIDADTTARIEQALLPAGMVPEARRASASISSTVSFGSWFQPLTEAIQDGVRCTISYRSQNDTDHHDRTVDPIRLVSTADAAYLIAWDVDRDAERRYRLDRIARVTLTDDSATTHAEPSADMRQSLLQAGESMVLDVRAERYEADIDWAGVVRAAENPDHTGWVLVTVKVAARRWLFDQVLAAGGDIRIVEPEDAARAFAEYAQSLIITP